MGKTESIQNEHFQVLKVEFPAGATMPFHRATSDALVITQKGKAVLTLEGESFDLLPGENFMIDANASHKLDIVEDFVASVILEPNAQII